MRARLGKAVTVAAACAVLMLLGAGAAWSEPEVPPPDGQPSSVQMNPAAHVHDGFYARVLVGPAGLATHMSFSGDHVTLIGAGGSVGVAVGWAVSPSLVIYGEAFDDRWRGLYFKFFSQSSISTDPLRAGMVGIGPGLTYYLPSNLYLSATLAFSKLTIRYNDPDFATTHITDSDIGVGVSGALGKEWWVSDRWGLGLAGQLYLGSIPDGGVNAQWNTASLLMAFSATYN